MQAAIERMKRDTQAVTDIAATFLFYHIIVVGTKRLLVDGQGAVDTSAALYAFLFSIALETAAMFAMMVAYSTPKVVTASPASVLQEPKAQPSQQSAIGKEEKPSNVVALVSSNPPAGFRWSHGSGVYSFAVLPIGQIEIIRFIHCAEFAHIQRRGKKRYLVGVRLQSVSSSQRTEPMAQMGHAT